MDKEAQIAKLTKEIQELEIKLFNLQKERRKLEYELYEEPTQEEK